MPVKGLTDVEQPRYFKKIRLGIKGEKGVPQNVDHFVIDGAPEIQAVYGDKPTELHAMFYCFDPELTMPTWNKWYDASGFLICQGDGNNKNNPGEATYRALNNVNGIANLTSEPGRFPRSLRRICMGQDCPDHHARGCGMVSQIRLVLPLVNMYQIYEITTGSINTVLDFQAALRAVSNPQVFGAGATAAMRVATDLGFGPVFTLKKVAEKRGGLNEKNEKITRSYKYLTLEICEDFWDTHGLKALGKLSQINGHKFASEHLKPALAAARSQAVAQLNGAQVSEMNQAEPDRIDVEAPPPEDFHEDPVDVAAQQVSTQQNLENDPEIIAAVKSVYDAKKKPMPKNAVKNALVRYNNDKAAVIAASKATAAQESGQPAAQPPQQPPPPQKQQTAQPAAGGNTLI